MTNVNAHGVQLGNGRRTGGFHRVSHGDESQHLLLGGEVGASCPPGRGVPPPNKAACGDALGLHQAAVAGVVEGSVHPVGDALARGGGESQWWGQAQCRRALWRPLQWLRPRGAPGGLLQGGCHCQQLLIADPSGETQVGDPGLAFGDSSGLSSTTVPMLWATSSASADLIKMHVLRPFAGAHHDSGGGARPRAQGREITSTRNADGEGQKLEGLARQPADGGDKGPPR